MSAAAAEADSQLKSNAIHIKMPKLQHDESMRYEALAAGTAGAGAADPTAS